MDERGDRTKSAGQYAAAGAPSAIALNLRQAFPVTRGDTFANLLAAIDRADAARKR